MLLRLAEFISYNEFSFKSYEGNIIINVNILRVCQNITRQNFSYSKGFQGAKYVEKVERKVENTAFHNIKDLTNHNSNITKFGSSV